MHADHAGVSAQLGPWKVQISLPPGSLSVLASNSLWIVITRFDSAAPSVSLSVAFFFYPIFHSSFCNMFHVGVDDTYFMFISQANVNVHMGIVGVIA